MRCARLGVWMLAALVAIAWLGGCRRRSAPPSTPAAEPLRPVPSGARTGSSGKSKARQGGDALLLRGGRVMTAAGVIYPRADVLVVGDRIEAVGVDLPAPEGAAVLDVKGKTITPGIIDAHSHIGVYAAPGFTGTSDGNETSSPNTAEVQAADGYWPQDPQIERAREGGVTTMQILPGSANLVGGRSVVVKTYPDARTVDEARFPGAPDGLKIACGENPKRVHGEKGGPVTRMGNLARMRAALQQAVEYRRAWKRYRDKLERWNSRPVGGGEGDADADPPDPPARDFALETLVKVIDGDILVHNHCYRADEMSLMMELGESFGFRIRSFHHAVEAYKIADQLAEHGAAASVWADWWGFKVEAFDGIRENAAMVAAAGARAVLHSDSALGIQRLNQEAAKAMYAGRRAGLEVSDDEALRWLTANPAWALGIDGTVGTLEPGKQADLVVWDGDPFSVYTKTSRVYIEGRLVFDREHPGAPSSDFELGYVERRPGAAPAGEQPKAPGRPRPASTPARLPFDRDGAPIVLTGAKIQVGDGTVIDDGTVIVRGTRISAVGGAELAASAGSEATRVDLSGMVLTPGFIAPATALGLVEISMEPGTVDKERKDPDPIRAGYDAAVAVNADSALLPVNAIEGVTTAAVTPTGGLVSGQVAWIDLVAGDHRGIVVRPGVAVHARLGQTIAGSRAVALARLDEAFVDAKFWQTRRGAYDRRQSRDLVAHPRDLEALVSVLDGTVPLVVSADRASDLLALVSLRERLGLSHLTIVGATQGFEVADALARPEITVLVQPSENLPGSLDRMGARFDNAALLHAAGVRVGIGVLDEAHNVRNMAQEAGIAVAYGLPHEAAISAVTQNVAIGYAMDDHYGTIAAGKVADLVAWSGDPFELSHMPTKVWIRGEEIPMTSRQTKLRDRYLDLSRFGDARHGGE